MEAIGAALVVVGSLMLAAAGMFATGYLFALGVRAAGGF